MFKGMNIGWRSYFLQKKVFIPVLVLSLVLLIFYYVQLSLKIQTVVEGRIYRSPQLSANFLGEIIKEKGIKTIINLRGEDKDSQWYIKETEIAQNYNVKLYDCRLSAYDLPKYRILMDILEILLTSERPILIHCAAGVDRTGFVSALALAIEKDLPLFELKKQFSWKYGVLGFFKSIGPQCFSYYEQWLDKTQRTHSRENLIYRINHEYVDSQGNFEFDVMKLYARSGLSNKSLKIRHLIENLATKVIEPADWKGTSGENVYQNGEMYWTGRVSVDVLLKGGSVKFIIQAIGSSAKGVWPHMVMRLDNEIIGEVDVTSERLQEYEFKKPVKPGKYNLSISFTNDEATLDKTGKVIEDRNLFVRRCRITYDE